MTTFGPVGDHLDARETRELRLHGPILALVGKYSLGVSGHRPSSVVCHAPDPRRVAAPALGAGWARSDSVGLGRTVPVRGSSCAHPRSVRSPCGRSALRFVFIRTLHEHVRVRRARSRSGTLPTFRRRSNEDRARPRRAPGAPSGAHRPAVGPGSPLPALLSPGVLSGVLKRRTTGIRLIARRSVSTTGNVTLKLPRGPIPTVSRQYYWHPGAGGDPRAGPTRRRRDAPGRGPTRP